jgi:hypothetical protein
MKFFEPTDIAHNSVLALDGADDYLFGLLQSRPFTVWAKSVSGRLGMSIRLSPDLSYNSFPAPEPTSELRAQVTAAAQEVLRARDAHPSSSLADLYDPLTTPPDLMKAHQDLDKAVLAAYRLKPAATNAEVLAELFSRYEKLTSPLGFGMTSETKQRSSVKRNGK